jgi:non-ribosomal peptide synthetase component F
LQHVLVDSQSAVVLTLEEFRHRVAETETPTILLDDCVAQSDSTPTENLVDTSVATDSAYIIYTSGDELALFCRDALSDLS